MEVSEKQRSAELNIAKFIRLLRNRTLGALDQIQY